MKLKSLLTFMVAGTLLSSAQSQGYKDGVEYYKAGQYEDAKTILLNTFNNADTDKAMANYYLGETSLALKDAAAAQKYFEAGVAANPECPYNYVGLGEIDLFNNNKDAAEDDFDKANKYGKKNHEIKVCIARAYWNANPELWAKEIDKLLEKAHKDSKHQEPSIYILEGDMLLDKEDVGGAAGKYEMAIRYDSANPEGYVKYANGYFHVNPQFSINKLEEFLKVAPNSALGQRELAEKYFAANRWRAASDLYGRYIQNPNHFPEDKARYSVLLYWGEDYTNSLNIANEVLAQDPNNFLMQRMLMLNKAKMGQNEEAVAEGEKFFANNVDGNFTANDYTTYGDCLLAVGKNDEAYAQYELAATKFPERADLLSNLSDTYSKNGESLKAAETYDRYIAALEEPSLNDILKGSTRWLNATAKAAVTDTILRQESSAKGIKYIDEVIERAEAKPSFYQIKAGLNVAGNCNQPNAAAIESYLKMAELLDQDPANMQDKASLNLYKLAYTFIAHYYGKIAVDEEKAKEFSAKYTEVKNILEPPVEAPAEEAPAAE